MQPVSETQSWSLNDEINRFQEDLEDRAFIPDSGQTVSMPIKESENRATSTSFSTGKIRDLIVRFGSALMHCMSRFDSQIQHLRIEIAAFTSISLLLLIREGLRRSTTLGATHMKIAALAMLVGILVASWKN